MTDVSVVVVNYNTFQLTCKCIESIIRFTSGITFEIILVDNGSTEISPDNFQQLYPTIRLIKSKVNVGFSKGNNAGIKIATGSTVLLINSDAEVTDNSIGELHKRLHSLPGVGVITCKLVYPDKTIQHQCGRFPSIKLQFIELLRLQKLLSKRNREELLLGGFFDHNRCIYPDWIWGTFFMFKRQILEGFTEQKLPETYFMYQEDLEWCYLIQKNNYKIFYDPAHAILHHFSASSSNIDLTLRKTKLLKSNLQDFIVRFYGKWYANFYLILQYLNLKFHRNSRI